MLTFVYGNVDTKLSNCIIIFLDFELMKRSDEPL